MNIGYCISHPGPELNELIGSGLACSATSTDLGRLNESLDRIAGAFKPGLGGGPITFAGRVVRLDMDGALGVRLDNDHPVTASTSAGHAPRAIGDRVLVEMPFAAPGGWTLVYGADRGAGE